MVGLDLEKFLDRVNQDIAPWRTRLRHLVIDAASAATLTHS
jgi:hypothetical protein